MFPPRRAFALFQFLAIAFASARFAVAQELRIDTFGTMRYDNDAQGNDVDAFLRTDINITNIIKDHLDLRLSGYGDWDLDGNDSYDRALNQRPIRLSEGYLDIKNYGPLSRLRIGRQYLYDIDYLHFDGVSVLINAQKKLSWFAFGGRPVTYYESENGDWLGGGGAVWKPNSKTKHQFDSYLLHEGGETFIASAWRWNRNWGNDWRTNSRLRFIDGRVRDYRLLVTKHIQPIGVDVSANYFVQPGRRGAHDQYQSRNLAALSNILGVRQPYQRLGVDASKFFGEQWMLNGGASIRRRFDNDENYNSLNSETAYVSLTRFNALIKGLDLTLGAESTHNEQDNMWGITGSATYRPSKKWEFGAGVSYSQYNLDPIDFDQNLNDQEEMNLLIRDLKIPLYFFDIRWKPSKTYDFRGSVSWQDTDQLPGNGWRAQLGMNYHLFRNLAQPEGEKP